MCHALTDKKIKRARSNLNCVSVKLLVFLPVWMQWGKPSPMVVYPCTTLTSTMLNEEVAWKADMLIIFFWFFMDSIFSRVKFLILLAF